MEGDVSEDSGGAGLDAFARSDHFLDQDVSAPSTDALTTYGGLAEATTSIQLVVLVPPLTFRRPAVIVKSRATDLHSSCWKKFRPFARH